MRDIAFLKNPFYLITLAATISAILVFLFFATIRLENKIEKQMLEISTSDVLSITRNSAKAVELLLKNSSNYVKDIRTDTSLQGKIEEHLKILPTKNIKYAYLLYRDKRGVFRFLADASPPDEKALINQKFDVLSAKWIEIYDKKEPLIISHDILHQLSISYLVPILYRDSVELVLAIDFSVEKVKNINSIIDLMKKAIVSIIVIVLIFIIILIIQTVKYFIVKKTAFTDKLTNVHNRNYLHELEDYINLNDYVLATLDIDFFKKVNDTYGHDVGDMILKQMAAIMLNTIRKKDDIVIRYGGEEFLILAKIKRKGSLSALNVIERIFTNIQTNKFNISNEDYINLTVSIGVNLFPHKSRTFSEAFKLADIALYKSKHKGRNCIELYDEEESSKDKNGISINEIKDAIDEDRVICYFQKIIDTKTKEISHYEALLRIVSKNGDIITPDKILPPIKGTFIVRNISKRVLEICYNELLLDQKIKINVNLNPQDIINESILDILKSYAEKENISNRLGIEIVESEDIVSYKDAKENILMLKKLGYKIFIDDFGSGYSNFIYLTQIDADYIKIDGEIIKKIVEDKISFSVVKSIVNFAKESNIKVIAEYVENEAIYEKIKLLDIEYAQGYLFSIPQALHR